MFVRILAAGIAGAVEVPAWLADMGHPAPRIF